jgi:hypothetical protein
LILQISKDKPHPQQHNKRHHLVKRLAKFFKILVLSPVLNALLLTPFPGRFLYTIVVCKTIATGYDTKLRRTTGTTLKVVTSGKTNLSQSRLHY